MSSRLNAFSRSVSRLISACNHRSFLKMVGKITPLMQQYWDVKNLHEDKILFFRMGDFYELFHSDALTAAPILGIALTSRNKNSGDETPMCGVPHHSAPQYINKLLAQNFKIAICDQVEDAKFAKGLVKRAITRILSPGMVYDPEAINQQNTHYLAAYDDTFVSFLESTTGEAFYYKYLNTTELNKLTQIMNPVELVLTVSQKEKYLDKKTDLLGPHITVFEQTFSAENLPLSSLRLLAYVQYMQGPEILHTLQEFEERKLSKRLEISPNVLRHLEIFKSYRGDEKGSFFAAIDRTKTAAGARKLKNWILFPSTDAKLICSRQNEIDFWFNKPTDLEDLRKLLSTMGDIERRLGKISNPGCNARDLLALKHSLEVGLEVTQLTRPNPINSESKKIFELVARIKKTIVSEPPLTTRDGQIINQGVSAELDEYIRLATDCNSELLALENKEKLNTGISSLKVRYNNVFGFYIEINKNNAAKAPGHYMRKQTLANAERFVTDELQEIESKVLSAKSKRFDLEFEIFNELKKHVLDHANLLIKFAHAWSELDVVCSLAWLAIEQNYVRPQFGETGISLKGSRHPVVEQFVEKTFVPNDIVISSQGCMLLTGPNMAGKSTLMRQLALTVILAQIGSFVPARSAELPLFEKIFTRVGASDYLSEGLSTFMVEMVEAAEILNHANSKSLVILDEIGRGTSTYDGMSLAQSILEYLVQSVRATILFATHYHELTDLDQSLERVENFHMKIVEHQGQIEFLHTLTKGPANKSYGIEVAKKAGLPLSVIKKAQKILNDKEYVPQNQLSLL